MIMFFTSLYITAFSRTGFKPYFGQKRNKLAIVQVQDSMALLEYFNMDHKNVYHCKLDTLKFNQGKYLGKFSEMVIKENGLIIKPGNITLRGGIPDSYRKPVTSRLNL
jgi:hypothetical protein